MPFWAFYRAGSYDASLLHFWVSLLKLLLFMLLFKYFVFLIYLMSQLISFYVFCMILAKFIELRTHLLIFDYS